MKLWIRLLAVNPGHLVGYLVPVVFAHVVIDMPQRLAGHGLQPVHKGIDIPGREVVAIRQADLLVGRDQLDNNEWSLRPLTNPVSTTPFRRAMSFSPRE